MKIVVMEIEGGRQYSLYSVCEADRATPGKSRGPKKETNKTRCRSPSDGRFGEGGERRRTATINGKKGNKMTILIERESGQEGVGRGHSTSSWGHT